MCGSTIQAMFMQNGCCGMLVLGVGGLLYSCGPNIFVGAFMIGKTIYKRKAEWKLKAGCWAISIIPIVGPFIGQYIWYNSPDNSVPSDKTVNKN
jgi:hypothetical protein